MYWFAQIRGKLSAIIYVWIVTFMHKALKMNKNITFEHLVHVVEMVNDGVMIIDATLDEHPIVYVNYAFQTLTGYLSEEVLGKNCRFLHGDKTDQPALEVLRQAFSGNRSCRVDLENCRKNGTSFWSELSITPFFNADGKLTHYLGIQKDITQRKAFEKSLHLESQHDPLTQVYNRRSLDVYWNKLNGLRTQARHYFSVMIIDVDGFKSINEHYGHAVGDKVLIALAEALLEVHRAPDLVVRFGGDEFLVLLVNEAPLDVDSYLKHIDEELHKHLKTKEIGCSFSYSVGYATANSADSTPSLNDLIIEANKALCFSPSH